MQIDYVRGICKPYDNGNVTIRSEEILDVQKIVFSFLERKLEFVCLTAVHRYFFYQDERTYIEIQRLMYDHPRDIKTLLLKYYSASGLMKDLLVALYSAMCEQYNTTGYRHLEKCMNFNASPNQFDLNHIYHPIYERPEIPIRVANNNLYEKLCFLLPQNLPQKRAEIVEQERIRKEKEEERARAQKQADADELVHTIHGTYDMETDFSHFFASLVTSDKTELVILYEALAHIENQKRAVEEFAAGNFISPEEAAELMKILNEVSAKLSERIQTAVGKQRIYEFGSISENRAKFRISMYKLSFTELLELFQDYKNQETAFLRRKDLAKNLIEKASYDPYINLYRYGSILISDRMNQLNRNKAKQKHIPQNLLDQSMLFYYDTDSLAIAYETQRKEKYSQEKESGDIGERRVKEALKWLDSSYVQIHPLSKDYSGNPCIYLQNQDYLNVKQEYDHIVVGKTGVFVIETKNYAGKLIVDQYGNWRRILQDGREVGEKNPLEQIRKHEKVLRSFLDESISLISIICIANDRAIIEGIENSPLPIIKSDLLVEFIEHYESQKSLLTAEDIQNCVSKIYDHMLKS